MPGPIWYTKQFSDGGMVVASAVEHGLGVKSDLAHIFFSNDGEEWMDVFSVKKDVWKMPLFKNGVINFADGAQSSQEFYFSAEGLSRIDGRVYLARIGDYE